MTVAASTCPFGVWSADVKKSMPRMHASASLKFCKTQPQDFGWLRKQEGSPRPQCARLMKGVDMVMVESPTYYRAYQPVLLALQATEPQTEFQM
jgi:hypothetical protein